MTFTRRRADYELACAHVLVDHLPRVYAALASGELDHHKVRVFTDYLAQLTPAQADRICERMVPRAPGWTTSQLAARLLREVQAIDPGYTRRTYEQAVRERAVHGYLDHTGTAVLSGSGLPTAEAAAAAARLEALAEQLRAVGYPATVNQTRADLYLRLLDGTLDGLTRPQILATMLELGPLSPADDPDTLCSPRPDRAEPERGEPDHQPPHPAPTASPEQPAPTERSEYPAPAEHPVPNEQRAPAKRPEQPVPATRPECAPPAAETSTTRLVRYGVEVRVRLSTLLGLDNHPAELPSWGPIPAEVARDLVAAQHHAEWRIAVVDIQGYLVHGENQAFFVHHHVLG